VGGNFGTGDNLQNEENFRKIRSAVSGHQDSFHFFPQKDKQQVSISQGRTLNDKIKRNLSE